MTIGIAAACENGEFIVSATDGLLSGEDVAGESILAKMHWFGPWQFLYAGNPAVFALVVEDVANTCIADPEAANRGRIQETVRRSYRRVISRLASTPVLNPFDVTVDELKDYEGTFFGEHQGEILRQIAEKARDIRDQILVLGWGQSQHSAMIYEVGPDADLLYTDTGFATIGSGYKMAETMLLLLGQGRHLTLPDTIFNVACAKFFSEKSRGLDVGNGTAMHVSKKLGNGDTEKKGQLISAEDIASLRHLWETHLKPRIPDEIRYEITSIAQRANGGKVSTRAAFSAMEAMMRLNKQKNHVSQEDQQDPQSTTDDPSPQPPSQE